jgi:hypothetical protein
VRVLRSDLYLLDFVFALLLVIGCVLVLSSASVSADECSPSQRCFPPISCHFGEGTCVAPDYTCGGNCPGGDNCNSWGDPCTCYFYDGTCSQPFAIIDGVPQYNSCYWSCCDSIFFCIP